MIRPEVLSRLVQNAERLGHQTQVTAVAVSLYGEPALSLCCWCAERLHPEPEVAVQRLRAGGECDRCPYVGRDCLLVLPRGWPQTEAA